MADRINELYQATVDAKAKVLSLKGALNAMMDQQGVAKATFHGLLQKQATGGDLPAEEAAKLQTDVGAARATYNGFDARISAQRELVADAERSVLEAEKEHASEQQRLAAEDATLKRNPSGRTQVGAPNAADDPKRGFVDHKEFLRAVQKHGMFGVAGMDERLKPLAAAGTDEGQTSSNPYGGFLVPHGIAPGILSVTPEDDPIAGMTTAVPMTAPTVSYNARVDKNHTTSVSGGFIVTRRPETVAGTTSRTKFEQVTLVANEEWGFAFATERIITDSPTSFVAIIQAGFRDEYVANGMNERVNGTGVGERQGILNTPCRITVSKETGQSNGTIVTENIDKMAARCWRYGRAVWIANHTTRPQLRALVRVVGTGGSIVPYFTSNPGGQEFLDGRPIYFCEFAPALGSLGDLMLIVPSEYLEGTYQSEQYAESMHVRFDLGERAFRFYRRNDGQWWWTSALTPKHGDTLSPVVVLEARS